MIPSLQAFYSHLMSGLHFCNIFQHNSTNIQIPGDQNLCWEISIFHHFSFIFLKNAIKIVCRFLISHLVWSSECWLESAGTSGDNPWVFRWQNGEQKYTVSTWINFKPLQKKKKSQMVNSSELTLWNSQCSMLLCTNRIFSDSNTKT